MSVLDSLENRAIQKAEVQTQDGVRHPFLVKALSLSPDNKEFALFDEKGELFTASAQSYKNKSFSLLFFNGVWIDGNQVWTLDIVTKDKKMLIGELIALGQ